MEERGESGKGRVRPRNPEATRRRILIAARQEFARKGLAGARVDLIARRAKANKQLLYHYFGGKDGLYLAVLEAAYGDIREAEAALELEHLDPVAALRRLVEFTWEYYLKNPDFSPWSTMRILARRAISVSRSGSPRSTESFGGDWR